MTIETWMSINSWALPLNIEACKPYTEPYGGKNGRWVTHITISFLCFALRIEY